MYDVYEIRKDFPELALTVNGRPNTFLDTAASAQKPEAVPDETTSFYRTQYANVHRGAYYLSEQATFAYEQARDIVAGFIGAAGQEVVFTRSATESINLVAASWGMNNLRPGDEILLSEAEHHANLVPWQTVRDRTGCTLKFFAVNDDGSYNPENFYNALSERTKLVGVTGMSNVLGTVFPIREIIAAAHAVGALCLVDACQSIVHQATDVRELDCDFLAFSGHKLYGPTGIGVLYGKHKLLAAMPPYQTGGDMVRKVTLEHTDFAEPPARFEAGTPAIAEAVGLGAAVKYVQNLGMENIAAHEKELLIYAKFRSLKSSVPRRKKAELSLLRSATSMRRTWLLCWTRKAWPFAPVTIAPSRLSTAWATLRLPEHRLAFIPRGKTSTVLSPRSAKPKAFSKQKSRRVEK